MVNTVVAVIVFLILAVVFGLLVYLIVNSGNNPPPQPPPPPTHTIIVNFDISDVSDCKQIENYCISRQGRLATKEEIETLFTTTQLKYCEYGYGANCTPYLISSAIGGISICQRQEVVETSIGKIPCDPPVLGDCLNSIFCYVP